MLQIKSITESYSPIEKGYTVEVKGTFILKTFGIAGCLLLLHV